MLAALCKGPLTSKARVNTPVLLQEHCATDFLERALALADVIVWRLDLLQQRLHYNAVGFKALGLAPTEAGISMQDLRVLTHPDDVPLLERANQQALMGSEVVDQLARYRFADGNWRHQLTRRVAERDAQGVAVGLSGIAIDVTELQLERAQVQRLQHERQREQQREQFAIEAAAVGIWERDLQGHVLYWNETMYRQRGCTSADPRHPDRIMADTTHPADRAVLDGAYGQHIASGEPYREELRLRLPDGSERWILAHGRPLRGDSGSVVRVSGINLDITAQKTAALLQQEKLRAEQASRDKSTFMARMSHQLRTPMNAVLGFSQLMRDDPAQPMSRQQLQRLGLIEQAGRQLLALIDSLLEIAQRTDDAPRPGTAADEPQAAVTPAAAATAAVTPAAAATAATGLHVLCVEDNPVNLILVREVLAMRPQVRLRCAEDGHSGIAAALQEPPDVLLLDLQLPDISGHEVFNRLHRLQPLSACRFIALSADAMPESVESALAAGFDDYWTKPIQFDRFLTRIDELVAQRAGGGWSR